MSKRLYNCVSGLWIALFGMMLSKAIIDMNILFIVMDVVIIGINLLSIWVNSEE